MSDRGPVTATKPPTWRIELRAFAELFALCGFAIAQPLLDVFGRSPTQFIFRGVDGSHIVQFALAVTFIPPLALWIVEAIVGRVIPRARSGLNLAFVAVLVAMFVIQAARNLLSSVPLFLLAAVAAVAAAMLRQRTKAARLWLRYAAVAPLAFLGLFLFTSESSRLIFADNPKAAEAGVGNPAPVVMLVFDEFPLTAIVDSSGNIERDLYPNLAELADGAHWFRNATTVSGATWYAVPSIDTGMHPRNDTAPIAVDHPESIFTLLGNAYDLNVTETMTRLCPTNLCQPTTVRTGGRRPLLGDAVGIMQARLSFSGAYPDPAADLVEPPAEQSPDDNPYEDLELNQPERFQALTDGMRDDSAALHYLHVLLPHVPYRYLPSGLQYDRLDLGRDGDTWTDEPWLPKLNRQRLQLQVGYVDTLVGELISTMRERGLYDEALFILTADHGISFQPGGPARAFEGQPLDEHTTGALPWVPLFIKEPGQQQGSISDANVELIDILPTIADVLDVDLPWSVDGQSALGPERPHNTKTFVGAKNNVFGIEALDPVEIDGDVGWASVLNQAVDTVLPPAGEEHRLWRIGPASDLVGMSVEELPEGELVEVPVRVEDAGAFDEVDPASGTVPALVRGSFDDLPADEPIAISVNGVVGATAPSYLRDEVTRFVAMVDPALFRPGANEVQVYRVVR